MTTIGDKVVFIKRAKPPFGWAIPGGYVEVGETAEQAAQRELKEETNLDVRALCARCKVQGARCKVQGARVLTLH